MITAEQFSRQGSVWRQATPTVEHFTRWCNTQLVSLGTAVPSNSDPKRNSLIAETAFMLSASGFGYPNWRLQETVADQARAMIMKLPRGMAAAQAVDADEWQEIYALHRALYRYTVSVDQVHFRPRFRGCGVVDEAEGDIAGSGEIIEVKAVTRPFRGLDFRQLLTYSAMSYAQGETLEKITLLNPRRASYFSSSLDAVAEGVSGRSAVELLQDLRELMIGLQTSA